MRGRQVLPTQRLGKSEVKGVMERFSRSARVRGRKCLPYIYLLPYFLVLSLLGVCLYNIVVQSFGIVPGYAGQGPSLDAYAYVFANSNTLASMGLSLYIAIFATIPSVVIGVLLAWCLVTVRQEKTVGNLVGRLLLQIPHTIACVLIVNMFLPSGILPRVFEAVGFTGASELFRSVLYWPNSIGVILEYIWKESGYICFMVLPVMSGVSNRLGEVASNLGASSLKSFLHVTLPHCMPTVRTVAIIVFVYTFGAYETPFLLGSSTVKALPVLAYAEYGLSNVAVHRPIAMVLTLVIVAVSITASLLYYFHGVRREKATKGRF